MDKESTEVFIMAEAIADKAFEAWVEAMELELKEAS